MKRFMTTVGCVTLLLIAGCAEDRDPADRDRVADGGLFEDQAGAIGKARAVEDALRDSARARRRQIADQSR